MTGNERTSRRTDSVYTGKIAESPSVLVRILIVTGGIPIQFESTTQQPVLQKVMTR